MRAGTRVNVEQASKRIDAEADPAVIRGKPLTHWEESDTRTDVFPPGVVALARMEEERSGNTGSPVSGVSCTNWKSGEEQSGLAGWRIGPHY